MEHHSDSIQILTDSLLQGNRRALAKAISLVESSLDEDRKQSEILLKSIVSHTGKSIRIGITGTPGVGKSTFIEKFGLHCINNNRKPAILAIDPTSQSHGGSILGDKVRMPELARNQHAFIRPSPSRLTLGGVSNATREAVLLCEAAGFDTIIIETVGVGQSEVEVRSMTDIFLLLTLPASGDEVQGIKRGIMELSDIIFINKADGPLIPLAEIAKGQLQSALTLMNSPTEHWDVAVLAGSGLHGIGIDELWNTCLKFMNADDERKSAILKRRELQEIEWLNIATQRELLRWLHDNNTWNALKESAILEIKNGNDVPSLAAKNLVKSFADSAGFKDIP